MKKIFIGALCFLLFFLPLISQSDPCILNDPVITDDVGDAFGYIDIKSIYFFEKEQTPNVLYVSMQINKASEFKFQQTFAVFWNYKNTRYSCSLGMGFTPSNWKRYNVGKYERDDQNLNYINGSYNFNTGMITWPIPKEIIGNPQQGDILTDTWSNAFRRVGFIGRIGFTRVVIDEIILHVFGNNMWDYAPERGTYGNEYVVQY